MAHLEDLLHNPAVVLLEGHLIGLGGVDADEVGVVLGPAAVADALEEDLDEAQASAAGKEKGASGPSSPCRPRPPTAQKPGCIPRPGCTLNKVLPCGPPEYWSCHVYTSFCVT